MDKVYKVYIERETTIEQIEEMRNNFSPTVSPMFDVFKHILNEQSAAKVAPIHYAYWDYQNDGSHFCSECGCDAPCNREYREVCSTWCPICGAFMTEVRNND